jgi:hypothetical protein
MMIFEPTWANSLAICGGVCFAAELVEEGLEVVLLDCEGSYVNMRLKKTRELLTGMRHREGR